MKNLQQNKVNYSERLCQQKTLRAQKAAMFDLIQILKQQPDKTYTVDELEALIVAYIKGAEQI